MKCAVCLAALRPSSVAVQEAVTVISGDAVCNDHVRVRAAYSDLMGAVLAVQADIEAVRLGRRARWS